MGCSYSHILNPSRGWFHAAVLRSREGWKIGDQALVLEQAEGVIVLTLLPCDVRNGGNERHIFVIVINIVACVALVPPIQDRGRQVTFPDLIRSRSAVE